MWRKWRGSLFLLTWIILQAVSGLRHKTACYYFPLIVDPPCAATEMLLPTMFTLGVSSDVTFHSEIRGTSLKYKGKDEIRRCCQQRENDTVRDYCLPAMKNQLPGHCFPDFVSRCTAATRCQLSTPGSQLQNTDGADYVTFTFECVHTRVVSAACSVNFTDGDVSTKVDCKNPPASRNCSSAMFESKSNHVNMSIFMTVDPGHQEKEFLWIRAKADTGKNITVICGANIPANVSLNCPTTTTSTTSTTTTAATTATATTQTVTSNNASSNHAQVAVTSSPGKPQAQPSITTSARTTTYSNASTTLSLSSVNGFSSVITPRHSDPNSPTTHPQQSGVTETTSEATSPMDKDISTSAATTETLPSTPSKEVLIIASSVGGVILIAIIVTITVCVRRKKSSEKTNPTRGHMEENHEDGNESDGARNSVSDGYVPKPNYEGTDDYKLDQLDRKTSGDVNEGYEPDMESPYAYGFTRPRPAPSGLSLGKNSWVTQGHLAYFDHTVFNTEASGGHSEEKSDGRA